MKNFAVVAIGGNSLIRDKNRRRVEDQYEAIVDTARNLVDIIEAGYRILVTHGNSAQVGFILRRSEIAFKSEGLHFVPLAQNVRADTLIISTGVDNICLNHGAPEETALSRITVSDTRQFIREGHFAAGSMLPKITAIVRFLELGGEKAIIAKPQHLKQALRGETGTWVVND